MRKPFGAARTWSRALSSLRPVLALLLLLASGAQAFAAAQGPECARLHHAGQHPDALAGDVEASALLGAGHHHSEDRSSPVGAVAGTTCPPAATVVREVDVPSPVESSRLAAEDAAVPTSQRPGALFRPPRAI